MRARPNGRILRATDCLQLGRVVWWSEHVFGSAFACPSSVDSGTVLGLDTDRAFLPYRTEHPSATCPFCENPLTYLCVTAIHRSLLSTNVTEPPVSSKPTHIHVEQYDHSPCASTPPTREQKETPAEDAPLESPRSGSDSDAAYESLRGVLRKVSLGKYFKDFRRREVRLEDLQHLTEGDLTEVSCASVV